MTTETTYEYDLEIYNNHERYASWIASIKAGDRVGVTRRLTLEGEPTVGWVYRRLPNDPAAVMEVRVGEVTHTYEPGGAFEANHWVENTPKEKLVPGDQRLRLVPIRAVEHVHHAPVAGEYTVSVVDSPVRVEVVGQVALVRCPIHSRWQTWAKAHGGKWDATAKAWRMDVRDLDAIRAELIQRYGCDGSEERVRAVDVRVDTDLVRPPASSEWHLLGRKICGITPYGNFRMGDAVVVIRGKLGAQRTDIHAEKGTIIEVRGVPLAKALLVGESRGWKGLSFVKRGERVEALLDQGQPAPAPILAPGARDLPPMRTGRSGQAPSAAALVHRAHLIAAIEETLEDLSSSQGTSEEERTIQAIVKAGPDELRELFLDLDGDWWTQDAQHDAMRGRPVPLLFRLDRWVAVGLGGSSNRATDAAAATAIMGLVARQLVRGTATTNTTPNTPVSVMDTPIVEVEKEAVSITDITPADEGEVGSLSVVDTAPLVEVEDTPAHPTTPSTRRRSRKRDLTDGLVDTKPVRGADILVPAAIPFAQLDSTPVSAADVCRLRATLGLTTTQFGVLLGSSRQRVYVWETEGTASAHGSISALIRLYLAQIPLDSTADETTSASK